MAGQQETDDVHWFWDGYLDWADYLAAHKDMPPAPSSPNSVKDYVPIFLRLRQDRASRYGNGSGAAASLLAFLQGDGGETIAGSRARIDARIEPNELEALEAGISQGVVEFYAYIPRERLLNARFRHRLTEVFDLLDVGSTVALADSAVQSPEAAFVTNPAGKPELDKPVVAIIDDGIGFLNERFTRVDDATGRFVTRFDRVWIQAREKADPASASRVLLGRELSKDDIDLLLAKGARLDEFAEYARLNAQLLDEDAHRSTEFQFSHGTHVLDVAAGADPFHTATDEDRRVRDWPLLAVQLPPESIEDTSGTRFETHVVMGVRWILSTLGQLYANRPPVIINISLGILAGPKNGTKFLEYQVARELARYPEARVVYAYGNNYLSRQVAFFEALGGAQEPAERTIEWVTPPDDFTASFVEIHLEGHDELPAEFAVGLTDPAGQSLAATPVASGSFISLVDNAGHAYARIYHVPSRILETRQDGSDLRTRAAYVLALAPTARHGRQDILAPSGSWTVTVRNGLATAQNVILQIQRGDTAPGYDPLGRQSYFDGPNAYDFDPETLDYTALGAGPITHRGTHSALTTVHPSVAPEVAARIHRAAGAVWRGEDEAVAADYSALSADWSNYAPTDSAVSEDGYALEGVLASATTSASIEALSGTSAAAPQVCRALAKTAQSELDPTVPGPEAPIPITDPLSIERLSAGLWPRVGSRNRS
ncbi:S8 family serine peptidase [Rhizobium halophytocola]|uniref:Peptidase S8/S53 domain-containing protein n=1 Tax=Rhizobium halophytocola TaxID=735519 RepID=A0ABS4DU32_9HYPH|nr:S8 family serine peptidase [Rhizobium halophytocola]MBP1849124.1 hypothetical protein [Rhizobium halophytocola]